MYGAVEASVKNASVMAVAYRLSVPAPNKDNGLRVTEKVAGIIISFIYI